MFRCYEVFTTKRGYTVWQKTTTISTSTTTTTNNIRGWDNLMDDNENNFREAPDLIANGRKVGN